MPGTGRWGLCPVCGHKRGLRKDGTLRAHPVPGLLTLCAGSGQRPKRRDA